MRWRRRVAMFVLLGLGAGACTAATADQPSDLTADSSTPAGDGSAEVAPPPTVSETAAATTLPATTTTTLAPPTTTESPFARPEWLGTRVLELRADGFGQVLPTPPELIDRRFTTPDQLPPPTTAQFTATVGAVPPEVVARSSWHADCPVALDELAYVTMSHVGFDGALHTGEMIVNARVADDVVAVFAELFESGFPIEEMRVTRADEIDAPPTGDGNVTGSFACRDAVNSGNWSQHAYGLAIDINPFHNPYLKGDLVIPELASYYLDRDLALAGMVETGVVVEAFAAIGWTWGGNWNSLKDWMHFSENGH